jgi:glutamyl-Q tRNA(Asp) synthetase
VIDDALALSGYVGRFAPSPTGPLHAGSLVAALASWLDARAHGGRWLVRIEDVDAPRCVPGAGEEILRQLAAVGLVPDEPPRWQHTRSDAYRNALDRLLARGLAYGCACTRQQIAAADALLGHAHQRHGELIYPGTCRPERGGLAGHSPRAWRLRLPDGDAARVDWIDRRLGPQAQDVASSVGDFVLLRADGLWAYQLAVVVDDADQGITHVVRGEDLADNTPRQILLQRALGLPTPCYLHTPLVLAANGEKLSKQHGAMPLDLRDSRAALGAAVLALGLKLEFSGSTADWLASATTAWQARWALPPAPQSARRCVR